MTRKLISAAMTVAIGIGGGAAGQDPPQPQQPQPEQRQTDRKPADQAQDVKSRATRAVAGPSKDDQRFMQDVAEGGKAEVALGNLALQRAASDDVKQFAQRMVDDHSKANQELTELASQKNISLPYSSDVKAATGGVKDTVAGVRDTARDPRAVAKEGHTQADQQTASGRPATGDAAAISGDNLTGKHRQLYDRLSRLSGAEFDREYMKEMVKGHNKNVSEFEKASQKSQDADLKAWAAKSLPTLREHQQMARDISSKVGGKSSGTTDRPTSDRPSSNPSQPTRNP